MTDIRAAGNRAGVIKYDIITALTVAGLHGDPGFQVSMTRLTSLITARYNWRADLVSIGQKEMSQLWGIGERTVKREIKRWLETNLVTCIRPGVRGRVASYRLDLGGICDVTKPIWHHVGTDFSDRMCLLQPDAAHVIRLETVRSRSKQQIREDMPGWQGVSRVLETRFPSQYDAWIAPLVAQLEQDHLILEARSAFAAEYIKTHFGRDIIDAVRAEWGRPIHVTIRALTTTEEASKTPY